MVKPVPVTRLEGIASRQAHADLPENTYERELGQQGFFGPATHMYHAHPPTSWDSVDGPLKPRAFDTTKLDNASPNPFDATLLLHNNDVAIRFWSTNHSMEQLVRNADGDELLFIHEGRGELFCDYGHITLQEGDYLLLPRGTMWRLETTSLRVLIIEALKGHYGLPDKGLLGHHAIFDPAVLQAPSIDDAFKEQQNNHSTEVVIKRHGKFTTVRYPFNPLDAVGWHGNLMPVKLNWRDIRPVMSHRYHIPPSVHTTFLTEHFIVCTFCPRPIESDPGALKVPFFHSNDDYDEVIFYHRGQFFSRDNIHPGMVTLHPGGLTHGPHPKAFMTGSKAERKATDEVAVMIDSRNALQVSDLPEDVEWQGYVNSWKPDNEESGS
ncbi:MAG: homogentisate 1,2-dioxygenase [Gammaproteobacteria bacterium]|jgi:homogentisate 1,2-dioxygenase